MPVAFHSLSGVGGRSIFPGKYFVQNNVEMLTELRSVAIHFADYKFHCFITRRVVGAIAVGAVNKMASAPKEHAGVTRLLRIPTQLPGFTQCVTICNSFRCGTSD